MPDDFGKLRIFKIKLLFLLRWIADFPAYYM